VFCRLTSTGQLNFKDPKAQIQLTKSTLRRDFGLKIKLPEDRLCPPVR
jgi:23S rRNA A1618 N6-methylase RlmF